METTIIHATRTARRLLAKAGPYVLIELLLPGGTLIALLLFLYQRRAGSAAADGVPPVGAAIAWALDTAREGLVRWSALLVEAPLRGSAERDGLEPLAMSPQH